VALGAIGFHRLGKCLFPVVADTAQYFLCVVFLGHRYALFLHGKNFRVAFRAFQLRRGHVGIMAESDYLRSLGGILDVSPAHFLLAIGCIETYETDNAYADEKNLPRIFTQFITPFLLRNFASKQLQIFQQDLYPGRILSIFSMTRQGKISHSPDEGARLHFRLFAGQVLVNSLGCKPSGTHRQDDSG
jgi:hypothetical protein